MHYWKTIKKGKFKPKKEYFRHIRKVQNVTIYQKCLSCGMRRIIYKGDWKELSSFDTSFFITCDYEGWLNKQGFTEKDNDKI